MVTNTELALALQPGSGNSESGRPRVLPATHLTSTHCPHLFVFCSLGVLMAATRPWPADGSLVPAFKQLLHSAAVLSFIKFVVMTLDRCQACHFSSTDWALRYFATHTHKRASRQTMHACAHLHACANTYMHRHMPTRVRQHC